MKTSSGVTHAFLWNGASVRDLGSLGGADLASWALDLNDSDVVVGESKVRWDRNPVAFRYDGSMTEVGTHDWDCEPLDEPGCIASYHSTAFGVNASGVIVGDRSRLTGSQPVTETVHAYRHSGGQTHDLSALGGNTAFSSASAVNAGAVAVGESCLDDSFANCHAFLNNGVNHDLGTLGGSRSEATDINDKGQVVGVSDTASGYSAFLYEGTPGSGGAMRSLQLAATPAAINNLGQIVGGKYDNLAWLWDGGVFTRLQTLLPADSGWALESASDINDKGQIVGTARRYADGVTRAYILTLGADARKPDGRIRKGSGAFIGNNIYNTTATNQTKTGSAARGSTVKFGISVQNDGTAADRFTVQAAGSTTGYTVKYFVGTTDVTAAVVAGTYRTPSLVAGGKQLITAKVKVLSNATVGSQVDRLVTITSTSSSSAIDAVKFVAKRA